jgi:hypothetical protein
MPALADRNGHLCCLSYVLKFQGCYQSGEAGHYSYHFPWPQSASRCPYSATLRLPIMLFQSAWWVWGTANVKRRMSNGGPKYVYSVERRNGFWENRHLARLNSSKLSRKRPPRQFWDVCGKACSFHCLDQSVVESTGVASLCGGAMESGRVRAVACSSSSSKMPMFVTAS